LSVSPSQTVILTASANSIASTFALQLGAGVPTLSINATSISFGDVLVNSPATQSITLSSTGTAPVTISAASVSGTGFSVSGATFPLTLNPTQTATLSVEFNPIATLLGLVSGSLTITSNSSTNPTASIALSATAEPVQVSLTWDAPSSSPDPVAGYNVYRAPSGSTTYQLLSSVSSSQLAYTDTGVQAGLTYDYIVESVDASGVTSTPSNMASVTLP
jgi:predicted phage tail protein